MDSVTDIKQSFRILEPEALRFYTVRILTNNAVTPIVKSGRIRTNKFLSRVRCGNNLLCVHISKVLLKRVRFITIFSTVKGRAGDAHNSRRVHTGLPTRLNDISE